MHANVSFLHFSVSNAARIYLHSLLTSVLLRRVFIYVRIALTISKRRQGRRDNRRLVYTLCTIIGCHNESIYLYYIQNGETALVIWRLESLSFAHTNEIKQYKTHVYCMSCVNRIEKNVRWRNKLFQFCYTFSLLLSLCMPRL